MARTLKNTVKYFPHDSDASAGDTVTVLQSRFGNNGYAFWFKLLEKLAATEGHYLDCRNSTRWQLLLAKTGVNEITGVEIMKLLVEMEAIDKQLWEGKIIWCQNLVDNIADVYQNRRREIPQKPVSTTNNSITTGKNAISTGDNEQTKLNETKRNEIKRDTPLNPPPVSLSLEQVIEVYEKNICLEGTTISEETENELKLAVQQFSAPWVIDAIREACLQNNPTLRYIGGILRTWRKEGKLIKAKSE